MPTDKKRLTFVLPGLFVAGGVRFVFRISDQLIRKGCEVTIVFPRQFSGRSARLIGPLGRRIVSRAKGVRRARSDWLASDAPILELPALEARYLPDADHVFATAWQTARFVNSLPPEKGGRCYLIQHYETWSGSLDEVDATWRLPLRKLVVAGWLADLAGEKFGDASARVVNLGVDPRDFHPDDLTPALSREEREQVVPQVIPPPVRRGPGGGRPRVMMLYHHEPWKGCEDGFAAVEMARGEVDFDLVLFGAHQPGDDVPADTEFHLNPAQEKIRELYCSADVLLSPSWLEGGPMPPMEAMACGCAVVATNSRGIVEYAIHGRNALLSEPKDPRALAESLVRVLKDGDLRRSLARSGIETMKRFTWERSARQMLDALSEGRA